MEKRLIPLDCRPMRFFCSSCERHFAVGDNGEKIDRERSKIPVDSSAIVSNVMLFIDMPSFVTCTHCGEKCNISSVSTHLRLAGGSHLRGFQI